MAASREVRRTVSRILNEIPGSIRALSRASGVDHGTLIRVRDGELGLSDDAARRIIGALREWGETCNRLADELERVIEREADA